MKQFLRMVYYCSIIKWKTQNKNNKNILKHIKAGNVVAYDCEIDSKTILKGKNQVAPGCIIRDSEIGTHSYIGGSSTLERTVVGKYCSIAGGVSVIGGTHPASVFVSTHPIFYSKNYWGTYTDEQRFQEMNYVDNKNKKFAMVGNDVWIGAEAKIIAGVKIGNGAIIAAGAVVTKDVPPYAIVGGVPAKVIKYRFRDEEIDFLENFKWWDKPESWIKENASKFSNIAEFVQYKTQKEAYVKNE